jgi:CxxC motif-containing protein (DUF1111 family)
MPLLRPLPAALRLHRSPFTSGQGLTGLGLTVLGIALLVLAVAPPIQAQTSPLGPVDPGVRPGTGFVGQPLPGLTSAELAFFNHAKDDVFQEVDSVSGTEPAHDGLPAAAGVGLGPRFNMNSCSGCHAQPAVGGTSPAVNPQVAVATRYGARNTVPFFVTVDGPVREARFKYHANGTRDGGVHDLFTITGRTDAPGCNLSQPDFNTAAAQNNLIFRIPTPTYGTGLMETITDKTILQNKNANSGLKAALGIYGHANHEGNAGTITRFGWKAQNKSLEIFAGEAYNVEQGVTNELFQNKRDDTPGCQFNGLPEDHTNFDQATNTFVPSDTVNFQIFMRVLAPPTPAPINSSISSGKELFSLVGCAYCHTPSMTTGKSSTTALSEKPANLYSDLLVHRMGSGLADGIVQGNAGGEEFRTAPLWGVGQRIFFLHDGRTKNLLEAIEAHESLNSEANTVVGFFAGLRPDQKQDVLNFLRSL